MSKKLKKFKKHFKDVFGTQCCACICDLTCYACCWRRSRPTYNEHVSARKYVLATQEHASKAYPNKHKHVGVCRGGHMRTNANKHVGVCRHVAATCEGAARARLLLEEGHADPEIRDGRGNAALHLVGLCLKLMARTSCTSLVRVVSEIGGRYNAAPHSIGGRTLSDNMARIRLQTTQ
eukprot:996902-Pelagomonas_calceolata.AAC.8